MSTDGSGTRDLGAGADPVLALGAVRLSAEPGGQVQVPVTVRNPSRLVESYRLDVVGLDEGWWQALPPELDVFPGQEASATVVLTPPPGAAAAFEPLPFGIRVVSLVDATRSAVEEGDLEVGRVQDLQSRIVPITARARWRTTFRITYTNWGNSSVRFKLIASDPDERLGFLLSQDAVVVPIGGSVTVRLHVRPRKPFLRGSPVRLPFTVTGESPGVAAGPPGMPAGPDAGAGSGTASGVPVPPAAPLLADPSQPVLDAAVEHRPVLTRGVGALAALVLLPLVLAGTWAARLPEVTGARNPDAAPRAVSRVTLEAVSAERIRVRWDPVDRATGYLVTPVDPQSGGLGQGQPVGAQVTQTDMEIADGATQGCFVVQATRSAAASPPGEPACSPPLSATLPAPTGVLAVPNPDGTLAVSWDPQPTFDHRVLIDGAVHPDVVKPGTSTTTGVVPPHGECVRVVVVAVSGDKVSPEDAPGASDCKQPLEVAPASPSPTASAAIPSVVAPPVVEPAPSQMVPTGQSSSGPTPGVTLDSSDGAALQAWVAQLGPFHVEPGLAEAARNRVIAAGLPTQQVVVARAADLPAQSGLVPSALLVVYNGFAAQDEARRFCRSTRVPATFSCTPLATGQGR